MLCYAKMLPMLSLSYLSSFITVVDIAIAISFFWNSIKLSASCICPVTLEVLQTISISSYFRTDYNIFDPCEMDVSVTKANLCIKTYSHLNFSSKLDFFHHYY